MKKPVLNIPEDVKELQEKLKAIEVSRKRDVAWNLYKVRIRKDKPMMERDIIDLMIEFNETIKKTGI